MLIVSYTTPKYAGVYEDYLGKSCKHANVTNCIHMNTPEFGTWEANTRFKPALILKAFQEFNPQSVLYLDSDATVTDAVNTIDALIPPTFHSAGHLLELGPWYGTDSKERGLLTGTLYFRRSAVPLLIKWLQACKDSKEPDGPILERLIKDDLGFYNLPLEWCYIATQPDGKENKIKLEKPIVTHHQISRKLKGGRTYQDYKEKVLLNA